jgi:tRNA pseudouridine55 synthase
VGGRRRREHDDPSIAGALFIDKPAGMTSHDVVGGVRRALGVRRVGHAGTLDPMATGVLVLGVGPMTRLLGIVGAHDKEYIATIRLGSSTTTDDREGEIVCRAAEVDVQAVTDAAIREAVTSLTGTIEQRPSSVSAVKVDGKRSYQRVREGEDVVLPTRTVTIAAFEIRGIDRGPEWIDVRVRVVCSAGTYIRALARDVGDALGIGGHLTELRRTRSGGVRVDACGELESIGVGSLISPADFARRELPVVEIDSSDVPLVRNGGRCSADIPREPAVALIGPGEDLVAIVDASATSWTYLAVLPSLVGDGLAGKASREGKTQQADDQDDA